MQITAPLAVRDLGIFRCSQPEEFLPQPTRDSKDDRTWNVAVKNTNREPDLLNPQTSSYIWLLLPVVLCCCWRCCGWKAPGGAKIDCRALSLPNSNGLLHEEPEWPPKHSPCSPITTKDSVSRSWELAPALSLIAVPSVWPVVSNSSFQGLLTSQMHTLLESAWCEAGRG